MRRIVFILLLLTCGSAMAQRTVDKALLQRKGDTTYYNGKPFSGKAVEKQLNEKKKKVLTAEAQYTNGIADGTWREWYTDGSKKFEGTFIHGVGDGTWTEWNPDGSIKRQLKLSKGTVLQQ